MRVMGGKVCEVRYVSNPDPLSVWGCGMCGVVWVVHVCAGEASRRRVWDPGGQGETAKFTPRV